MPAVVEELAGQKEQEELHVTEVVEEVLVGSQPAVNGELQTEEEVVVHMLLAEPPLVLVDLEAQELLLFDIQFHYNLGVKEYDVS